MARSSASSLHGFLAIDKPSGWTSHDVVGRLRRLTGVRRIGHAGTLDPFATGLLVAGVGKATRLIQYVQRASKRYDALIKLGESTDTADVEGAIVASMNPAEWPALDRVEQVLCRFVGCIEQIPPAYSAVHVDGRRAYDLARAGEDVELPARRVTIHAIDIEAYDPPWLRLTVHCGTGVYIRSLARDLGESLSTHGYCHALRRTAIGSISVGEATTLDDLTAQDVQKRWAELALPPDFAVAGWTALHLSADQTAAWYHGQSLRMGQTAGSVAAESRRRVYAADGEFAGLGNVDETGSLRPTLVYRID